jgi:hypothetical protein
MMYEEGKREEGSDTTYHTSRRAVEAESLRSSPRASGKPSSWGLSHSSTLTWCGLICLVQSWGLSHSSTLTWCGFCLSKIFTVRFLISVRRMRCADTFIKRLS